MHSKAVQHMQCLVSQSYGNGNRLCTTCCSCRIAALHLIVIGQSLWLTLQFLMASPVVLSAVSLQALQCTKRATRLRNFVGCTSRCPDRL